MISLEPCFPAVVGPAARSSRANLISRQIAALRESQPCRQGNPVRMMFSLNLSFNGAEPFTPQLFTFLGFNVSLRFPSDTWHILYFGF